MRKIISLIETAMADFKPRKAVLKDGIPCTIRMKYIDSNGQDDYSGDHDRIYVAAEIGGDEVGSVYFAKNANVPEWDENSFGSWSSSQTFVNIDYRRLGVAKAMYDAFTKAGFKIIRSGNYGGKLSDDGHAFWRAQKQFVWKPQRKKKVLEGVVPDEADGLWNGKNVVAKIGDVRIVVDDPNRASYVTAWTEDNKRIGSLGTRGQSPGAKGYLSISVAEMKKNFRGRGIGKAMYVALLNHLDPRWKGVSSYLPDRSNKRQVPAIYKALGGRLLDADNAVIDRR